MDGDGNNPEVDDPNTPNVDESELVFDRSPCDVLFFGLDRFDNSGDAQTGVLVPAGPGGALDRKKSGGGFAFSGLHTQGDLLVISNFSNGGDNSTISVYKWDPTVTGNLRLLRRIHCGELRHLSRRRPLLRTRESRGTDDVAVELPRQEWQHELR